jgi:peptidoglycan/LPS O-acetylase OafA/YrhL
MRAADGFLDPETHRIRSLDGLRAVSILLVLFWHLAVHRVDSAHGVTVGPIGALGVRIFFVISGFLITTLLLRELAAAGRISLAKFYARRTLRIFPASYAYIAVLAALAWAGIIVLQPHDLVFAATYTSSYVAGTSWWVAHLWSLSVEEQFYLLWPGVIALGGRRLAEGVAGATVIAGPLLRGLWWVLLPQDRLLLGRAFPTVVDALAIGCLCAFHGDWAAKARRLRESHLWLMVAGLFALSLIPQELLVPLVRRPFRILFDTAANVLIAGWLLGSVTVETGLMTRLLNSRPLAALGTVSYSLYLWQQLFTGFAHLGTLAVVGGALGAATMSYWLLERPLMALRRNLRTEEMREPSPEETPSTVGPST